MRTVENNILTSDEQPTITVAVTPALPFIAPRRFELSGGDSQVELFFFGETEDNTLRQFMYVHFEWRPDHISKPYSYPDSDRVTLGMHDYLLRLWCFDQEAAAIERPDSDIAEVVSMLHEQGISVPGVYVGLSFARLLGDDHRAELLLIYGEQTSISGVDCENEEQTVHFIPTIRQRAFDSFEIMAG